MKRNQMTRNQMKSNPCPWQEGIAWAPLASPQDWHCTTLVAWIRDRSGVWVPLGEEERSMLKTRNQMKSKPCPWEEEEGIAWAPLASSQDWHCTTLVAWIRDSSGEWVPLGEEARRMLKTPPPWARDRAPSKKPR